VVNNIFRNAMQEITGDSWLDDLARASLSAADAKFSADYVRRPVLQVVFPGLHDIDARDSYLVTKAIQDATAKLAHIIRKPQSEISMAHPADRAKARLIQRGQAGNMILFSFPRSEESLNTYIPGTVVETLAERAVRELVTVLPSSTDDSVALDAVLAQRPTVRNAVSDIVDAVPKMSNGVGLRLTPATGDAVTSILSTDQANVLKDSLKESRVDRRVVTISGRLDGVRTKRRIFYLEPEYGGADIYGALDLELLDDIRRNLDRRVVVRLQEERTQALTGRRSRPLYRLLSITPIGEVVDLDTSPANEA